MDSRSSKTTDDAAPGQETGLSGLPGPDQRGGPESRGSLRGLGSLVTAGPPLLLALLLFAGGALQGFDDYLTALLYQWRAEDRAVFRPEIFVVKKDERTANLLNRNPGRREFASVLSFLGRSREERFGATEVRTCRLLEFQVGLPADDKPPVWLPTLVPGTRTATGTPTWFRLHEKDLGVLDRFLKFPTGPEALAPARWTEAIDELSRAGLAWQVRVLPNARTLIRLQLLVEIQPQAAVQIAPAAVIGFDFLLQGTQDADVDARLASAIRELECPLVLAAQKNEQLRGTMLVKTLKEGEGNASQGAGGARANGATQEAGGSATPGPIPARHPGTDGSATPGPGAAAPPKGSSASAPGPGTATPPGGSSAATPGALPSSVRGAPPPVTAAATPDFAPAATSDAPHAAAPGAAPGAAPARLLDLVPPETLPEDGFLASTTRVGFINTGIGRRGYLTGLPLFQARADGRGLAPSFCLAVATLALDRQDGGPVPGRYWEAMEQELQAIAEPVRTGTWRGGFRLLDRVIPTDETGTMEVTFFGSAQPNRTGRQIFPSASLFSSSTCSTTPTSSNRAASGWN